MKRLIIASNNAHKVKEIKDMLKEFQFEILSLKDAGIDIEVEEDRDTFMGNAYKKAFEIYETLDEEEKENTLVLSDDSGLAVDHLEGAPGVYSARYAGVAHDDDRNNEKLLEELKDVPEDKRGAQFVTAMVLLGKDLDLRVFGEAKGRILHGLTGNGGFGYDPLFHSDDLGKSFGVASSEEKNRVSHRGNALQNLIKELRKIEDRHRL
ncbi:RdgB/HAM1 family non-canonical purine NTP pyrophosphatase [Proteiniclasticum sp. SCR006]|uniref:dITP/XTP pyrophosphatase n=1 Tax=Proteiniclasticum aestuarii TaxID=2817862 RepID=A0A939KIX7_9CLOT|nr:RdgB/HAM1 family non-canonical purine NTP pyrophosphatase [Proteiniclasticum aestuarii]MBO1264598.1 RdgB/HAM1 family non-canonical purine NTP pyrophosphatase [Proteiniclasticum aestuarii]